MAAAAASRNLVALGIEGSANKIGVGIVDGQGQIYANPRVTYNPPAGEGFLPKLVRHHHRAHVHDLIAEALSEAIGAGHIKSYRDIDLICYTKGPGMGGPLSCGAVVARTLSKIWAKPIVGVNHCVAHIEMGRCVTGANNPTVIYASGGNTQVISYTPGRKNSDGGFLRPGRYTVFGETLDIAVGNCFDRIARIIDLPNAPAPGWQIEQCAKNANTIYKLPYAIKGMDMALSGISASMDSLVAELYTPQEPGPHKDLIRANLCATLQETVFAMLCEITERAMAQTRAKEVLLVGGVGCNLRLQEMMRIMAEERGGLVCATDDRYCIDNGAMIAWTGLIQFRSTKSCTPWAETTVTQRFRTDEVAVTWRD